MTSFSLRQVASFPFKGNTSFLIVMPMPDSGNVSSVLPKLNISDLYRRLPQQKMMQVNLPKVKLQYRQELQEALTSMGENVRLTRGGRDVNPPGSHHISLVHSHLNVMQCCILMLVHTVRPDE